MPFIVEEEQLRIEIIVSQKLLKLRQTMLIKNFQFVVYRFIPPRRPIDFHRKSSVTTYVSLSLCIGI